jgi:hypothetical protein
MVINQPTPPECVISTPTVTQDCTGGPAELQHACEDMLLRLNTDWPRPTLNLRTAAAVWECRTQLRVDRRELQEEVEDECSRLREQNHPGWSEDLVERRGIESVLVRRGWLKREIGGWC